MRFCQERGIRILLSLGGDQSTSFFSSEEEGAAYADLLWAMFLGGTVRIGPVPRPFGEGVTLDGIDLAILAGSPLGYTGLVNQLRALYATDPTKTYLVSAAPQCVLPDAFLGPAPAGAPTQYALSAAQFDFISVQFFNNFCGVQAFGTSDFNFAAWNAFAGSVKTPVLLGVLGAPYSGNGFQPAARIVEIVESLQATASWFGGYFMCQVRCMHLS